MDRKSNIFKNVAFFKFRKKKIRLVVMRAIEELQEVTKINKLTGLSESVQNFYGSPCGAVDINDDRGIDEMVNVLEPLIQMEEVECSGK